MTNDDHRITLLRSTSDMMFDVLPCMGRALVAPGVYLETA